MLVQTEKILTHSYMNQKWINFFGFFLKPAVRFEAIAVLAKDLGVSMEDPGVDTQDNLESLVSIKPKFYRVVGVLLGYHTPSGKYLPAIIIPPCGTTRGRPPTTAEWKR